MSKCHYRVNLRRINLKKPERPFKNLRDFRRSIRAWGTNIKSLYPCYCCHGYGKHYHPDDHDPIEGYKMACRRVVCPTCGGKGKLSKIDFIARYDKEMGEWKEEINQWRQEVGILKGAFKKLTNEEIKILNENF